MSCTVIKGITALLLIVAGMQLHAQSNILVGYKFSYVGSNFHAKAVMYGAGIGYRHVKAETDLPGLDEVNRTLLDDNHWVANASIGIEVKSKAIAFAIQPYATYPLMETDVAPIETDLVGSTTSSRLEDFLVFGVRLTLYNGKQHRN